MAIKGLEQAVENLSRISKTAVPGAAAMAINRVATTAMNQSASQVARETKVRRKLVKERARLKKATVKNPHVKIIVNRGDLPVIKLGIRITGSRPNSTLRAGQHRYQRAFIQRLKNGRWHVMQRVAGKNRYPIDVVKIPMAAPLTTAFKQNIEQIRRERLSKELEYALKQQLRIAIKR
ncbi:phage tail protein [Escherichia albertii]|uniref:Phage tail protein n=2 Tax=Escherichia albertii TaxID=208962 RepID=A0AAX3MHR6_ESCAL|nr:phage tail protein [Escherichia albertii]MCU7316348.1 phage tail protein [Escherichia albertii]MCU7320837.1 phage tail protein [Escherichia albertii]MCZ8673073.1 phage tail protein [Escherichia albertii]WDB27626.1 phage tail protein [Escherichia albertii]HEB0990755.1 phage tail protein [Escherichia albertii]